MNRHSRFITAILSVMLIASACTVTAYAEDMGEQSNNNEPSYNEPSYNEPSYNEPSYNEPSYNEPSYNEPSYNEPSYNEPSYNEPSYNDGGNNNDGYYDGDGGNNNNNNNNNNNTVYYDENGNAYTDSNEVYVGSNQTYSPPASTAPSAPLYDTSKTKVDENTLNANDWKDIQAKLSASTAKASDTDNTGDFAFIQNNTASGDNGHLILIIGIALIAVSVAGFIYLIVSAVRRRKQNALAYAGKAAANSNGSRYRANDDYADNYGDDPKPAKKPKNGRRYK